MFAPESSPLFTPYRDPGGQTFYILTRRAAPQQQAFYFVNDSCSPDGRYLWLYASFPPAGGMEQHSLAVADLLENEVRVFHDAQFWAASPLLERGTDCALYTWENAIYRRSPRAGPMCPEAKSSGCPLPGPLPASPKFICLTTAFPPWILKRTPRCAAP